MRTIAFDLGARRMGVAISEGSMAFPVEVLEVRDEGHALELAAEACRGHGAERVVVGLPLNMDGEAGAAAQAARQWAQRLRARCGLRCLLVDERLSSFSAQQQLIEQKKLGRKLTRRQQKQRLDALAAARILQDLLDGQVVGEELPAE